MIHSSASWRTLWKRGGPALVMAALMLVPPAPRAAAAVTVRFEGHGAFFSRETNQPAPVDPQVFVRSSDAPAAVGPQNIPHAAGFVPAPLAAPPPTPLYNAEGRPLAATLGRWLGAAGEATVGPAGDPRHADRVSAAFTGLIPGGLYSLFTVTFGPSGNTFAPLDGAGLHHNFVALGNGTGRATVLTPISLTHANAIVLVYHSDGETHGTSRGAPGVTAHHQLIARIP